METDKLIEALRCCGNRDYKKPDCDHCPLLKTHMCVKVMLESAATALEDRGAMITEVATLRTQLAEKDKQIKTLGAELNASAYEFDRLSKKYWAEHDEVIRVIAEKDKQLAAAVAILRDIDWVGSGAKGKINDAIDLLIGPQEAGEVEHEKL